MITPNEKGNQRRPDAGKNAVLFGVWFSRWLGGPVDREATF